MAVYLQMGQRGKLRDRLEADAKSLYALFNYGRIHGAVRLQWGFLDETFIALRSRPGICPAGRIARLHHLLIRVIVTCSPAMLAPTQFWVVRTELYLQRELQNCLNLLLIHGVTPFPKIAGGQKAVNQIFGSPENLRPKSVANGPPSTNPPVAHGVPSATHQTGESPASIAPRPNPSPHRKKSHDTALAHMRGSR
jgi:hypothetical protein